MRDVAYAARATAPSGVSAWPHAHEKASEVEATARIAATIVKGILMKTVSRNALSKRHRRDFLKLIPYYMGTDYLQPYSWTA